MSSMEDDDSKSPEPDITINNFKKDLKNLCILILKERKLIPLNYGAKKNDDTEIIDKYNKYFIRLFDFYHNVSYVEINSYIETEKIYVNLTNIYRYDSNNWNDIKKIISITKLEFTKLTDLTSIKNSLIHITRDNYKFNNDNLKNLYSNYDNLDNTIKLGSNGATGIFTEIIQKIPPKDEIKEDSSNKKVDIKDIDIIISPIYTNNPSVYNDFKIALLLLYLMILFDTNKRTEEHKIFYNNLWIKLFTKYYPSINTQKKNKLETNDCNPPPNSNIDYNDFDKFLCKFTANSPYKKPLNDENIKELLKDITIRIRITDNKQNISDNTLNVNNIYDKFNEIEKKYILDETIVKKFSEILSLTNIKSVAIDTSTIWSSDNDPIQSLGRMIYHIVYENDNYKNLLDTNITIKKAKSKPTKRTDEVRFIKLFNGGCDTYKDDPLFKTLCIADTVHDFKYNSYSTDDIIKLIYGSTININLGDNYKNKPKEHITTFFYEQLVKNQHVIKYDSLLNSILFSKNDEIIDIDYSKEIVATKKYYSIPTTSSRNSPIKQIDYLSIDDINEIKSKMITGSEINGLLVDAYSFNLNKIFYNTINIKNDKFLHVNEETCKWDMASKDTNNNQNDCCTKNSCSSAFNSVKDFLKCDTDKCKKTGFEIYEEDNNTVKRVDIVSYNLLSYSLLKNKDVLDNYIELNNTFNFDNIVSFSKFDYTIYKLKSTISIDIINRNFKFIDIPTLSSVKIRITSVNNDNCNSYIFLIRKVNTIDNIIILKKNFISKSRKGYDEFNKGYINRALINLITTINGKKQQYTNFVLDQLCFIAFFLGYNIDKQSYIDPDDEDTVIQNLKNDGKKATIRDYEKILLDKFNNNNNNIYNKFDYIKTYNGKVFPFFRLDNNDKIDFCRFLLDLKRSGDYGQIHGVYNYNYILTQADKTDNITPLIFVTHDKLASVYARLLDVPTIYQSISNSSSEIKYKIYLPKLNIHNTKISSCSLLVVPSVAALSVAPSVTVPSITVPSVIVSSVTSPSIAKQTGPLEEEKSKEAESISRKRRHPDKLNEQYVTHKKEARINECQPIENNKNLSELIGIIRNIKKNGKDYIDYYKTEMVDYTIDYTKLENIIKSLNDIDDNKIGYLDNMVTLLQLYMGQIVGFQYNEPTDITLEELNNTHNSIITNLINPIYKIINNIKEFHNENFQVTGMFSICDTELCNDLRKLEELITKFLKLHKICYPKVLRSVKNNENNRYQSLSSSSSLMNIGGSNDDNPNKQNIFYIFEELYYYLDDNNINKSIKLIYDNLVRLTDFYIDYLEYYVEDDEYDYLADTILLILNLKHDIINAINNKDPTIVELMKNICSCLSLYSDSFILTLQNATVKLVSFEPEKETISEKQQIKSYYDITNLIEIIYNFFYNRALTNPTLAKKYFDQLPERTKEHIYEYDNKNRQRLQLIFLSIKTGRLPINAEQSTYPSQGKEISMSPQTISVYGGGRTSQFYIEYFMKNPDKMKKEDKKNIRNILKEEQFEDDLGDFIKSHLKL